MRWPRLISSSCSIRPTTRSPKRLHFAIKHLPGSIVVRQYPLLSQKRMSSAMSKRLEGKTILITGASAGIGQSIAREFARTAPSSLKLILTARRIQKLHQLADEIKAEVGSGVQVHSVQLDIRNAQDIANLHASLPPEFQAIDVLVNNAGLVKGMARAPDIDAEDMEVMFSTNVTGLINMTQAILPHMLKRGESGQGDIINIGSIAGREGYPGASIYCATKAAGRLFTEALRKELIHTRIRVIQIDPGQAETVGADEGSYLAEQPLTPRCRSFRWCALAETRPKLMLSTRASSH